MKECKNCGFKMFDRDVDSFWVFPVGFIILVAIIVIVYCIYTNADKNKWNNGHCECGGIWEYQQAVGHENSTGYLYMCDSCGEMREFLKYRGNKE